MTTFDATIDVRQFAPKDKHPNIFRKLESLDPGQKLELINDHDPKPLYYQLSAEHPNEFAWGYLESGPDVWRVEITKH